MQDLNIYLYNMITSINKFKLILENNENIRCTIMTSDEFYKYIYRNGEIDIRFKDKIGGGKKAFKYMQLQYDLDYKDKEVYFFCLFYNNEIVSLAHIRKSPHIENTYWLSYLCTDPNFTNKGFASKLSEYMFKWFKQNNYTFESSSYTEQGYITLKPLFNKLALKYNVNFIDKEKF